MIIVGLDLSLTSTGLARVDTDQPDRVEVHRIQSKGAKTATLDERAARLDQLVTRIYRWVDVPDLAVIEGPSFGQHRQAGQHDRAGLWWLITAALHTCGTPTVEIPPALRSKYATGKGNAPKDQVLVAAAKRYPQTDITGNDIADAVVLAAMGAHYYRQPIAPVPKEHTAALAKVTWPIPQDQL